MAAPRKLTTRERVIKELIDTEVKYVHCLQSLMEEYERPLRKLCDEGEPLLLASELDTIFGQLPVLIKLNVMMLKDLRAEGTRGDIGKVFSSFGPCLKMYTSYLNQVDDAMQIIRDNLETNDGVVDAAKTYFSNYMTGRSQKASLADFCLARGRSGTESLESLLIRPVQRIPRYRLLLQELLKHTPEEHSQHAALSKALAVVSLSAGKCNENIAKWQTMQARD